VIHRLELYFFFFRFFIYRRVSPGQHGRTAGRGRTSPNCVLFFTFLCDRTVPRRKGTKKNYVIGAAARGASCLFPTVDTSKLGRREWPREAKRHGLGTEKGDRKPCVDRELARAGGRVTRRETDTDRRGRERESEMCSELIEAEIEGEREKSCFNETGGASKHRPRTGRTNEQTNAVEATGS